MKTFTGAKKSEPPLEMAGALPFTKVPSFLFLFPWLSVRLWQLVIHNCDYNAILEYRKVPKTYGSIKIGKWKITQVSMWLKKKKKQTCLAEVANSL